MTDSNKNIVTAVTYHSFGESYSVEGSEDYLFTGKEQDPTGLYYYGARHYDPDLGRFLTRDPYSGKLVNPQSLNQYTYCYNNPLLFVDPDGRDPLHYEGPIYYGEEDKTLVYSHAPQLMGYVGCEEGYEWVAYFFIGQAAAFLFWLSIGAISYLFPGATPAAKVFIKWLVPTALKFVNDHKWEIGTLLSILLFIVGLIISDKMCEQTVEEIMSEADPEESLGFFWIFGGI